MIRKGSAKKLVVYVNSLQHYHHKPLYEAIVEFLYGHGCAGATVTRCVAGYGQSGRFHEARVFTLTEDVPMRIEAVDTARKIMSLLPFLYDMVEKGLIEVQDTEVIKISDHEDAEEAETVKHEKLEGRAKMVRIYVDEDDKWEGEPLYEAIVKRLRMMDVAGATVYKGLMGYGGHHRMHRSGWLGLSHNLPIMVTTVDTEEKINRVLPVLDEMVDEGLIVLSDVDVIKYSHLEDVETA
jgi:PII-like signaling protein